MSKYDAIRNLLNYGDGLPEGTPLRRNIRIVPNYLRNGFNYVLGNGMPDTYRLISEQPFFATRTLVLPGLTEGDLKEFFDRKPLTALHGAEFLFAAEKQFGWSASGYFRRQAARALVLLQPHP